MSRIGKMPIDVPSGVRVKVGDGTFTAEGPKGSVQEPIPEGISVEQDGNTLRVVRSDDSGSLRARHGLTRALISNAVVGVSAGFDRTLDIIGVGYKAEVSGRDVQLALGYSHPVIFPIPEGIQITVEKNTRLQVSGADRQKVGQVAAELRRLRPPEPYKGKGIRYSDEVVRRKVGKAGGK